MAICERQLPRKTVHEIFINEERYYLLVLKNSSVRTTHILDDFLHPTTIIWGAIWAAFFHYMPMLWAKRNSIMKQLEHPDEIFLKFVTLTGAATIGPLIVIWYGMLGRPYTESQRKEWAELGIVFSKYEK